MNKTKPEASCPNVGQEWGAKHSTLFKFATRFTIFYIFDEYVFSIFEKHEYITLNNIEIFRIAKNLTKIDGQKLFCDFCLCCAEQIIIRIKILKGIRCLRDYYEWIYFFRNISSSIVYQSTNLPANFRMKDFTKFPSLE